jgi:two-component system, OmpR family, alkaline phosphatase synthesis response regulator PhoP
MPVRRKPLVLIVDDEPGIAKTLAWMLEQSGYVTAIAYTGKDAVELASRVTAMLAIVDVNLPDLDGVKVAVEIYSRLPACKIVLITGDPNSAPLLEWLKTGERKFEFMAKPVEPPELLNTVAKLLA